MRRVVILRTAARRTAMDSIVMLVAIQSPLLVTAFDLEDELTPFFCAANIRVVAMHEDFYDELGELSLN